MRTDFAATFLAERYTGYMHIRRAAQRGRTELGWLHSRHTFSFGDYYDPQTLGFRALRVINDDVVEPGAGFGTHGHRDMEIISYVLSGALAHKDSLGHGSVIRPGDVQRMSAGAGVMHSEFNASPTEPVHFLQIWIIPAARNIAPGYEQKHFSAAATHGRLQLVASPDGAEGSVRINQDAKLLVTRLDAGQSAAFQPGVNRAAWIHVATGAVNVNGVDLFAGDDASALDEPLSLTGIESGETLVFELP